MDCMVLQLPSNIAEVATESPNKAIFLFVIIVIRFVWLNKCKPDAKIVMPDTDRTD